MKREASKDQIMALTKKDLENPVKDTVENYKEKNPVAEGDKLHKSHNNRRTVFTVKDAVENYKEENPVAEGDKLHKSKNNYLSKMKREAFTKGVLENPVDENEKSQNLQTNLSENAVASTVLAVVSTYPKCGGLYCPDCGFYPKNGIYCQRCS